MMLQSNAAANDMAPMGLQISEPEAVGGGGSEILPKEVFQFGVIDLKLHNSTDILRSIKICAFLAKLC